MIWFNYGVLMNKIHSIGAVLAACFYLAIMVTYGNDCVVAEQKCSSENTYIDYVETQIGNQEIPTNTIASFITICKSPIKKITDDEFAPHCIESQIQPAEYAYFSHPVREKNTRIFSNTDIIYPFNYFW